MDQSLLKLIQRRTKDKADQWIVSMLMVFWSEKVFRTPLPSREVGLPLCNLRA